jgi:hypothetical protein
MNRARRVIAAAAAGSAAAASIGAGRSWQLRWGATDTELRTALAGDDLITAPDLTATRAITIYAPADLIRPWIAQLGERANAACCSTRHPGPWRR